MEAFAEIWVKSSWALLSLCFSSLERNPCCVFIPRMFRDVVFAPQTSRQMPRKGLSRNQSLVLVLPGGLGKGGQLT